MSIRAYAASESRSREKCRERRWGLPPSPATTRAMFEFAAPHEIAPKAEVMLMSAVNAVPDQLHEDGPSRRLVLKNGFE